MGRLALRNVGIAVLVTTTTSGGCSPADDATMVGTLEQRGEALFTEETFEGNGRVCSTCHELDLFGTITPEHVEEQFALDPEGPLFRALDSDDGDGRSYRRLREHATIRIPIAAPYDEVLDRSVRRCDAPAVDTLVVFRGNPSVFNAALEEALMHDGREGGDLETQALNAVLTHAEPGRDPTPEELTAIARFQESLFSHAALKAFLDRGEELRLPDGDTPSQIRGRAFFEPDRPCGICHSGPMLNRVSEFHPDPTAVGGRAESTSVGAEPDNPNEKFEWCFVDPTTDEISPPPGLPPGSPEYLLNGRVFRRPVADPGTVLFRNPALDFTATMPDGSEMTVTSTMIEASVGLPLFKIPTLWGTPDTAPYFHDNSARTLDEVLEQYNFMFREDFPDFAEAAGCDPDADECLSAQDRRDIIAYLQLLSFEDGGIRPRSPE